MSAFHALRTSPKGIHRPLMVGLTDRRLPSDLEQWHEIWSKRTRAVGEYGDDLPHGIAPPKVDMILSLVDGFVWVCWPGTNASVRLGNHETVIAVMRDFLTQCEIAERLANARIDDE